MDDSTAVDAEEVESAAKEPLSRACGALVVRKRGAVEVSNGSVNIVGTGDVGSPVSGDEEATMSEGVAVKLCHDEEGKDIMIALDSGCWGVVDVLRGGVGVALAGCDALGCYVSVCGM